MIFSLTMKTCKKIAKQLDVVFRNVARQLKPKNGFNTNCVQKIDDNWLLVENHFFGNSFNNRFLQRFVIGGENSSTTDSRK